MPAGEGSGRGVAPAVLEDASGAFEAGRAVETRGLEGADGALLLGLEDVGLAASRRREADAEEVE